MTRTSARPGPGPASARAPRLVAVGGLSGSGKSTLAAALALDPALPAGAVVLSSDVIRKRLAGVAPTQRLGSGGYSAAMTARVYGTLRRRAAQALAGGAAVVVDAVHARPDERAAVEAVAAAAGARFDGLWLDAPRATLAARAAGRRGGASDAGPRIVDMQLGFDTGTVAWTRIDAAGSCAGTLAAARAALAGAGRMPQGSRAPPRRAGRAGGRGAAGEPA